MTVSTAQTDHPRSRAQPARGIAKEMESTLLRSSFSPIVREGMDASAASLPSKVRRSPKPSPIQRIWHVDPDRTESSRYFRRPPFRTATSTS